MLATPTDRKRMLEYAASKTPLYIGTLLAVLLTSDAIYIFPAIAALAAATALGIMTEGKSDKVLCTSIAFMFAVLFANWFFNDIKKTLAFPLAYIFYRFGKQMCPDIMQNALAVMENALLGRSLAAQQPKNHAQQPAPAAEDRRPVNRRRTVRVRSPEAQRRSKTDRQSIKAMRRQPPRNEQVGHQQPDGAHNAPPDIRGDVHHGRSRRRPQAG